MYVVYTYERYVGDEYTRTRYVYVLRVCARDGHAVWKIRSGVIMQLESVNGCNIHRRSAADTHVHNCIILHARARVCINDNALGISCTHSHTHVRAILYFHSKTERKIK